MMKTLLYSLASFLVLLSACGSVFSRQTANESESSPEIERAVSQTPDQDGLRLPDRERILNRKLYVNYRRAQLHEIFLDLKARTGLDLRSPGISSTMILGDQPVEPGQFLFSLHEKEISVRELLEQIAEAGGFTISYNALEDGALDNVAHKNDVIVFWKMADDDQLQSLIARVEDESSMERCAAVEKLAALRDPRIYPVLFRVMADGSPPMALAAVRALDELHSGSYFTLSGTLHCAEDRETLVRGIERVLATRFTSDSRLSCINLVSASGYSSAGEVLLPLLDDPLLDYTALLAMGETGDQRVIGPLLERLKTAPAPDPDQDTGHVPIADTGIQTVISRIGGAGAIAALDELLEKAEDISQRFFLAGLLYRAGEQRGLDLMLEMLENETGDPPEGNGDAGNGDGGPGPPSPLLAQLATGLAATRNPRVVQPLIELLDDDDPKVRCDVARELGTLRTPLAIDPLIALLDSEETRLAAIQSLRKIGSSRADDAVAVHLSDPDRSIRFQCGMYFLDSGDLRGADALHESVQEFPQNESTAYVPLAMAGSAKVTFLLTRQLDPADPESRAPRDAADMLGRIRDLETIAALVNGLQNQNGNSSFAAARAIAGMRGPRAMVAAMKLLKHEQVPMRVWGARILEWIADDKSTEALIAAATDESPQVRQHAGQALAAIGTQRSLEAACKLLKDPVRDVRRYTAVVIGKNADDPSVRALLEAIHDSNSFVRDAVANALVRSHHPAAIKQLVVLMKQADERSVRESAGKAMGNAGFDPNVWNDRLDLVTIDMLTLLTRDEDATVRAAAAEVLGTIGNPCANQALEAACDDPDPAVCAAAEKALELILERNAPERTNQRDGF